MAKVQGTSDEQDPNKMLLDVEPFFPYKDIVIVLVGSAAERFEIHKGLICQYPFFEAAFQGNFQESEGTLRLPELDPAAFRYLVYWLYKGRLDGFHYPSATQPSLSALRREWQQQVSKQDTSERGLTTLIQKRQLYNCARYKDAPFDALIKLYLVADYVQVPGIKDQIINSLIDVYAKSDTLQPDDIWLWCNNDRPTWTPNPVSAINLAWRSLPPESNLCKLLTALFCDNVLYRAKELQENEKLESDFLTTVFQEVQLRRFIGQEDTDWSEPKNVCYYHDHDGNPCKVYDGVGEMAKVKWEDLG
ncbi:MAG: hypothetical protein Q9172_000303 [Xanthocarpia lactea]